MYFILIPKIGCHAADRFKKRENENIRKTRTRVFPQHLSKSQRLLRRLTSFQLVDFSRRRAIPA